MSVTFDTVGISFAPVHEQSPVDDFVTNCYLAFVYLCTTYRKTGMYTHTQKHLSTFPLAVFMHAHLNIPSKIDPSALSFVLQSGIISMARIVAESFIYLSNCFSYRSELFDISISYALPSSFTHLVSPIFYMCKHFDTLISMVETPKNNISFWVN